MNCNKMHCLGKQLNFGAKLYSSFIVTIFPDYFIHKMLKNYVIIVNCMLGSLLFLYTMKILSQRLINSATIIYFSIIFKFICFFRFYSTMDSAAFKENSDSATANHDPILMSMLHDTRIPIRFFETSSTCRLSPDSPGLSPEVDEDKPPSPPDTQPLRPLSVIAAATDLGPLPMRRRKHSNTLLEAFLHSPVAKHSITTIPEPSELEYPPRARARHMSLVPDSSAYYQAVNYFQV